MIRPIRKSILLDILFTILTGGLFNLWVQYRQIRDSNKLLPETEQKSFLLLMIFSFLTFGIYFVWHEYKMTRDMHLMAFKETIPGLEFLCGLGTVFGLWFLVDSYQQSILNEYVSEI